MMESHPDPVSDGQSASSSTSKRLPVNPRRHKVAPEQRKRVVRACNACNNRRVKCSGELPCDRCVSTTRICEYTASETDRNTMKEELERLRARCFALEQGIQTIAPNHAPHVMRQLTRGELPNWAAVVPCPSASPGSSESDEGEGRFLYDSEAAARCVGEFSGATFLDQLKRFMRTLMGSLTLVPGSEDNSTFVSSIGRHQTYDSRPLTDPDVNPGWLPGSAEMNSMLRKLRMYIQDGNGTYESGGLLWWGDLVNVPKSNPLAHLGTMDGNRHLAFYHICFALSVSIGHTSLRLPDSQSAEAYFKRARMLLGNPLDAVHFTLTDVPALSLMAFYLIEVNRRDAAYMYVGIAVHIAIMHGAFRYAADEASKRVFWTLYILDRWISVLMGRPPSISDESIRLPLPAFDPSMPPCTGLCANIELARISGYVVHETYGTAPRNPRNADYETGADAALKMLDSWHLRLPMQLQVHADQALRDPSCCTMHMSYNHLIILATRPIFFAAIKKVVAQRIVNELTSPGRPTHEKYIRACTDAAQRNLQLARMLQPTNRSWLQSGLHFLFNAAVVLLLDRISSAYEGSIDTDKNHGPHDAEIVFAIRVFEQEAETGTNYQADCCKVLQGLRALSDRCLVTQRELSTRQRLGARNHHAASPRPATPCGQETSNGTGTDCTVRQEMLSWSQADNLQATLSL